VVLALTVLVAGMVWWLVSRPPRFVASSHFTVLGFTNLPAVDAFAHGLLPKYPSVVRIRVRNHVMWYAVGRNRMGRQESGFAFEVSAVGHSPEAAMQEAYRRMLEFRNECRACMDVDHGGAYEGDANDVRPYSALRDSVLHQVGLTMRRHCRSDWMWGLWFRLNHELERMDNERSAEHAAQAEARRQAEAAARPPTPVPGPLYE
jgi:hypothetical protein